MRKVIYVAGPLYTPAERQYLEEIDVICRKSGFDTYLPHRDGGLAPADGSSTIPYFEADVAAMRSCAIVVAVLNGVDVDSGAAWELGYMYAYGRPLIGIYEDTRVSDPLASINLMITSSVTIVRSRKLLETTLRKLKQARGPARSHKTERVSVHDVDILVNHLRTLPLDFNRASPDTFGHETSVLCCLDAVLSINRPYRRFVTPRLNRFRALCPSLTRLSQLARKLQRIPAQKFGVEILNYNDPARVELLQRVVQRLIKIISRRENATDELDVLKTWAIKASVDDYVNFEVRGIGLATYQYLRMLFGADTVKPDVHISKFVSKTLGRRIGERDTIKILEAGALRLGVSVLSLDHAIWSHQTESSQLQFASHL